MRKPDPYPILESRIRTGVYPVGTWLESERQLAEDFGVHRQSIRRAVARLCDAGLVERRPGHRPIVRRAEGDSSPINTVALLMGNEPLFHSFQQVLRGCEHELRAYGYRLVFIDTLSRDAATTRECEFRALDSLLEHPVAGLVVWSEDPVASLPRLERLRATGMPIVAIDRFIRHLEADFVGVDNFDAATRVVQHLCELRHKRIGLVTLTENTTSVIDREDGFRSAMKHFGLTVDDASVYRLPESSVEREMDYKRIVHEMLQSPSRPTALFAVNDVIAWRLLGTLMSAGKQVPEDIAIVGFDDIEAWAMHEPVLTTIRQPYEDIGRHAARLILRRFEDPQLPIQHVLLDTPLVVRATTVAGKDGVRKTLQRAWASRAPSPATAGVPVALR